MRESAFAFFALLACDPILSVQGRVRSPAPAGEGAAIPGADVALVCPRHRETLAKTDSRGEFSYASIGHWPEHCALEASTFDGSHRSVARSISELCRASGDRADCQQITSADFTLPRLGERRRARLVFRPDDARIQLVQHLGAREEVLCTGACETELLAGEHRLSLKLHRTSRDLWREEASLTSDRTLHAAFVEDTDPIWPSMLGTAFVAAGAGMLLYAGWKEQSVPAVAGVSSIGVGLALSIIWMPGMHSAEVRWEPEPPAKTTR
jgi:hypothetical protein